MEALSKYHLGYDVHGQALECCIEIDRRVIACGLVELVAQMLDLALESGSNSLHPTGCEEWVEHLPPDSVCIRIDQANGGARKGDASIEGRFLVEARVHFGDFLKVTWRVDVKFVDSNPDHRS